MLTLSCRQVMDAVGGVLLCGSEDTEIRGVKTDSRKIEEGDLFIPLKGERFDGHDFILESLNSGAAAALTCKPMGPVPGKTLILVSDSLKALGDLAAWYRSGFKFPLIGVTGSVGKTGTKDMIAAVLSRKFKVLKNEGNLNNAIGLPLTLFNLDLSLGAAVVEMGMSGLGEISYLTSVARPDTAVITNIGVSHIGKLGSKLNILRAKLEILEGLKKDGPVMLNGDDHLLYGLKGLLSHRAVFFGTREGVDLRACNIRSMGERGVSFSLWSGGSRWEIRVPVPGAHNVYTALAAIAVGMEFGMSLQEMAEGIAGFSPGSGRMNVYTRGGLKIIDDTYNASPQSAKAAIDVLKEMGREGNRTLAILGDMLELGEWAGRVHEELGRYVSERGIDCVIAVGKNAGLIADGAREAGMPQDRVFHFEEKDEALKFLGDFVKSGDLVLVKGSRGMKMEKIVEYFLRAANK